MREMSKIKNRGTTNATKRMNACTNADKKARQKKTPEEDNRTEIHNHLIENAKHRQQTTTKSERKTIINLQLHTNAINKDMHTDNT